MSHARRGYGTNQESDFQFVVIGKTGNGKSSTCNSILGRQQFAVGRGVSTTTVQVQSAEAVRSGCSIKLMVFRDGESAFSHGHKVVDTPDLAEQSTSTLQQMKEVAGWKDLAKPGPTAVLLAVRCDVRYTPEEYAIYRQIKQLWGDDLKKRLVVAFTFGDCQDRDIKEELKHSGHELQSVLKDAKQRYVVFYNKSANSDGQVHELIRITDGMSKTCKCC